MAAGDDVARLMEAAQRNISRLLFVGLGLSVAAVFLVSDIQSFVERAALVHGNVVALEWLPLPWKKAYTAPHAIVRYTGERGDQRTIRASAM